MQCKLLVCIAEGGREWPASRGSRRLAGFGSVSLNCGHVWNDFVGVKNICLTTFFRSKSGRLVSLDAVRPNRALPS
jgi:hypothetical protein